MVVGFLQSLKPYTEYSLAKELVQAQKLRSCGGFRDWEGRPGNVPTKPNYVYKDIGWVSWCEFLGQSHRKMSKLLNFPEVSDSLGLFSKIPKTYQNYKFEFKFKNTTVVYM